MTAAQIEAIIPPTRTQRKYQRLLPTRNSGGRSMSFADMMGQHG
jgi:hypothetical protein